MKKLFILISMICINSYIEGSLTFQNYVYDSQSQFLGFMEKCQRGLYAKAFIEVDRNESERYTVIFSAQDFRGNLVAQETRTTLPFDNHERRRRFFDLISSFAATQGNSTSQAVRLIVILLGKEHGKIEFEKDTFSIEQ